MDGQIKRGFYQNQKSHYDFPLKTINFTAQTYFYYAIQVVQQLNMK